MAPCLWDSLSVVLVTCGRLRCGSRWSFFSWGIIRKSAVTSHCVLVPVSFISLTSSRGHFIISHRCKEKGEYSRERYLEWELGHIDITFLMTLCDNCSILSLLLLMSYCAWFINWSLSQICMDRKKKRIIYVEFGTICGFRHPLGVLRHTSTDNGRLPSFYWLNINFSWCNITQRQGFLAFFFHIPRWSQTISISQTILRLVNIVVLLQYFA